MDQIWAHFILEPTRTPRPELRQEAARRSRTSHRRSQHGEDHSAPRMHSQLCVARLHKPHTQPDLPGQSRPQASPQPPIKCTHPKHCLGASICQRNHSKGDPHIPQNGLSIQSCIPRAVIEHGAHKPSKTWARKGLLSKI